MKILNDKNLKTLDGPRGRLCYLPALDNIFSSAELPMQSMGLSLV
jgi:hypothetical protein